MPGAMRACVLLFALLASLALAAGAEPVAGPDVVREIQHKVDERTGRVLRYEPGHEPYREDAGMHQAWNPARLNLAVQRQDRKASVVFGAEGMEESLKEDGRGRRMEELSSSDRVGVWLIIWHEDAAREEADATCRYVEDELGGTCSVDYFLESGLAGPVKQGQLTLPAKAVSHVSDKFGSTVKVIQFEEFA
ncbi:unnamed protein product [Pedinophyceae sp. YPF-701]|nr:unnamed protein product [Pedinophyceae sp. YPF-701]